LSPTCCLSARARRCRSRARSCSPRTCQSVACGHGHACMCMGVLCAFTSVLASMCMCTLACKFVLAQILTAIAPFLPGSPPPPNPSGWPLALLPPRLLFWLAATQCYSLHTHHPQPLPIALPPVSLCACAPALSGCLSICIFCSMIAFSPAWRLCTVILLEGPRRLRPALSP
jgi:hypothetical protein